MKSSFHVIKRKGGLLEARYWARYPDGTKKQKSLYGRDKKELRERWIQARAQAARGESNKTGGESTSTFLLGWIESVQGIKTTTRKSYTVLIKKHIIPRIGKKPISEVDTETMQRLVNEIIKDGNSIRTAQLVKCVMSKALQRARVLKKTTRYVYSRDIELPTHRPEETKIWNAEELRIFMEACKGDKYEWFYLLCATYGLRRGEAIPIEWEDIDLERNSIFIRKQYIRVGNKCIVDTPKTSSSIRKLPILPHIREYLDKINPNWDKTGPIVSMDNGELVTPDKVTRQFKHIIRNAGLPEVNLHSIRHAVATFMKDLNVPVKDAQAILGHSTPLTTLKYYQHTDIEEKRENLTKYSQFIGF